MIKRALDGLHFFKTTPNILETKIHKNARKYEIDHELSDAIYYIKIISCSLNKKTSTGRYLTIEKTKIFNKIRSNFDIKNSELLGLIQFVNSRFDEDEIGQFLSYLCKLNGQSKHEKVFLDLVTIAVS